MSRTVQLVSSWQMRREKAAERMGGPTVEILVEFPVTLRNRNAMHPSRKILHYLYYPPSQGSVAGWRRKQSIEPHRDQCNGEIRMRLGSHLRVALDYMSKTMFG